MFYFRSSCMYMYLASFFTDTLINHHYLFEQDPCCLCHRVGDIIITSLSCRIMSLWTKTNWRKQEWRHNYVIILPISKKFSYNQSDLSVNIFIKFYQNPNHSKWDKSRKSGTDRQTDRQTDKVGRSHSLPDCDDIM